MFTSSLGTFYRFLFCVVHLSPFLQHSQRAIMRSLWRRHLIASRVESSKGLKWANINDSCVCANYIWNVLKSMVLSAIVSKFFVGSIKMICEHIAYASAYEYNDPKSTERLVRWRCSYSHYRYTGCVWVCWPFVEHSAYTGDSPTQTHSHRRNAQYFAYNGQPVRSVRNISFVLGHYTVATFILAPCSSSFIFFFAKVRKEDIFSHFKRQMLIFAVANKLWCAARDTERTCVCVRVREWGNDTLLFP